MRTAVQTTTKKSRLAARLIHQPQAESHRRRVRRGSFAPAAFAQDDKQEPQERTKSSKILRMIGGSEETVRVLGCRRGRAGNAMRRSFCTGDRLARRNRVCTRDRP